MADPAKKSSWLRNLIWLGIPAMLVALVYFGSMNHRVMPAGGAPSPDHPPDFPRASLSIERADGKQFPFAVEVATTPQQSEYGLMFRTSLSDDAGMLFLFVPDQPVSMWMANTVIPLDMLFVRSNGSIAKIVTNTEPYSHAPINSDEPVKAVIEINAGQAGKHGFKTGDKVLYPGLGGR